MANFRKQFPAELLEALAAACSYGLSIVKAMRFEVRDDPSRYLACYFASAIEISSALAVLADNGEEIGVPILARTLLEAYIDFLCLHDDAGYVQYIDAADDFQWAKIIDSAVEDDNEYLVTLKEPHVAAERLAMESRMDARKAKGIRRLLALDRFKRANRPEIYYSVYRLLCAESHNNISALIGRHYVSNSATPLSLTLYRDAQPLAVSSIFTARNMLAEMSNAICVRFGVEGVDDAELLRTEQVALRYVESRDESKKE